MEPLISVAVCLYNREELIEGCLLSLVRQSLPRELYEVIVVDNNSTDSSFAKAAQFCREHPGFRLVKELRQGVSHTRNRGFREARGKYVAYIDDDSKAEQDWCEKILDAFEKSGSDPVAVGGAIYPWYDCTPPKWFEDRIETRSWGSEKGILMSSNAKYGFSGSNMAIRKDILQAFGGFAGEFGMAGARMGMGEEPQLFTRIYKDYPRFWYDPSIIVYHWVPPCNMSVLYRLRRGFLSGSSRAQIDDVSIKPFASYMREIIMAFAFIIASFRDMIFTMKSGCDRVIRMQKIADRFGYLFRRWQG